MQFLHLASGKIILTFTGVWEKNNCPYPGPLNLCSAMHGIGDSQWGLCAQGSGYGTWPDTPSIVVVHRAGHTPYTGSFVLPCALHSVSDTRIWPSAGQWFPPRRRALKISTWSHPCKIVDTLINSTLISSRYPYIENGESVSSVHVIMLQCLPLVFKRFG